MNKYLIELFNELNNKNVNYAVLRGYETLPYKISHDIDIGVIESDLQKIVSILLDVSNKYEYKKVFKSKRKDFYQLYFYNAKNGYCVKFDLWTNFTYKGLQYLKIDTILLNIKFHNNIRVLDDSVELLLSFLKEFLHNGWIREDKCKILKEKLNIYGFYNKDSLYIDNIDIQDFSNYLEKQKFDLKDESKKFIKKLFWKNIKCNGFINTLNSMFDYLYKYIKDKLRKKSFFIVLIGPDGSGKTTLSKMMLDEIKNKTSCFTSSYYIHGRFGILPNLSTIIGKDKEDTKEMKFDIQKQKLLPPYSRLKIWIYMSYYMFDFIIGYFKLFRYRFNHTLIVADRYFYDYFYHVHFKRYPKVLCWIYLKLLPKPDLTIFLKADAKKIYKRKQELPISVIKEQQKRIEKLIKKLKNSVEIETDKTINETFIDIKKGILQWMIR